MSDEMDNGLLAFSGVVIILLALFAVPSPAPYDISEETHRLVSMSDEQLQRYLGALEERNHGEKFYTAEDAIDHLQDENNRHRTGQRVLQLSLLVFGFAGAYRGFTGRSVIDTLEGYHARGRR